MAKYLKEGMVKRVEVSLEAWGLNLPEKELNSELDTWRSLLLLLLLS